ncbi:hypothetical protein NKH18_47575 [Streptomyces sp. M10(2022)]
MSLWLNTMHPGMRAPWFGLHLRRGNSLIGARRAVFAGDDAVGKDKAWLKAKGALAPTSLPFLKDGEPQPLPDDAVHQFLLPSSGWAAVAGSKEAKELAKESVEQLAAWKRVSFSAPSAAPRTSMQTAAPNSTPRASSRRLKRPLSSRSCGTPPGGSSSYGRQSSSAWNSPSRRSRAGSICGRPIRRTPSSRSSSTPIKQCRKRVLEDLFNAVDTPYWRLKKVMDAWCALWFWPVDKAGLLDGSDGEYAARTVVSDADGLSKVLGGVPLTVARPEPQPSPSRCLLLHPLPRHGSSRRQLCSHSVPSRPPLKTSN